MSMRGLLFVAIFWSGVALLIWGVEHAPLDSIRFIMDTLIISLGIIGAAMLTVAIYRSGARR
jgi:hypothetical protein